VSEGRKIKEFGSITLDRNELGHFFIDQDDPGAPLGTRVILTPQQAHEVVKFIERETPVHSGAAKKALQLAQEWAANFPLIGEASHADMKAATEVYEACRAALAESPKPTCEDAKIEKAYEDAAEHARQHPHETEQIMVWVDVDKGIAPLVRYLQSLEGVRTHASCQGTETYSAYVLASWPERFAARLADEFDLELLGENWGYIRPINMSVICTLS